MPPTCLLSQTPQKPQFNTKAINKLNGASFNVCRSDQKIASSLLLEITLHLIQFLTFQIPQ